MIEHSQFVETVNQNIKNINSRLDELTFEFNAIKQQINQFINMANHKLENYEKIVTKKDINCEMTTINPSFSNSSRENSQKIEDNIQPILPVKVAVKQTTVKTAVKTAPVQIDYSSILASEEDFLKVLTDKKQISVAEFIEMDMNIIPELYKKYNGDTGKDKLDKNRTNSTFTTFIKERGAIYRKKYNIYA